MPQPLGSEDGGTEHLLTAGVGSVPGSLVFQRKKWGQEIGGYSGQ